jgi:hypothetical protein
VRGDLTAEVQLVADSTDGKYRAMSRGVEVVNRDVYWPRRMSVEPELMPQAGLNGSLVGCTSRRYRGCCTLLAFLPL